MRYNIGVEINTILLRQKQTVSFLAYIADINYSPHD